MRVYHYGFFFYVSNFILQLTKKFPRKLLKETGFSDKLIMFYGIHVQEVPVSAFQGCLKESKKARKPVKYLRKRG